jgi:hypothetical protein
MKKVLPAVLASMAILVCSIVGLDEESGDGFRDLVWRMNPFRSTRCGPFIARGGLKLLASAQLDFRALDRDGNGIQDFWRGDVAGLYSIRGPDGNPIRLCELRLAAADARPQHTVGLPPAPYDFHWFRAIPHEGETRPDPNRFAFCMFPHRYRYGFRWTYILDEKLVMYRKRIRTAGGVTFYPADPAAAGWERAN